MDTYERNQQLELDDKKYVWHPFTQMKDFIREKPLIIEKGEGSYLWDTSGNKYLDGTSSLWTILHGHNRKEINHAIIKQIENVSHSTLLGLSHPLAIDLAKKLIKITPPGLTKVFYSESGSTAVEIALKIAFQYWLQNRKNSKKRKKFISLKNAYHGDTIGSVSVGGIELFHNLYKPLLFETLKGESIYCYRCNLEKNHSSCNLACLAQLEELIKVNHEDTAALIIEPMVQGAAGMLVFPPDYLKKVRNLCTKYNILMIADEVAVGFGRTGKMFACEHEDVRPDILTLGKGITGGYLPLAATIATDKIFNGFLGEHNDLKAFYHGHTYTGNPLACAAAMASLDIFEKDQTLIKLKEKIELLENRLNKFYALDHVGDIRQLGFMAGIELVLNRESKEPFPLENKIGIKVITEARKRGLIIRPLGDVIIIMPHLSITTKELDELLSITFDSIKFVTNN